MLCGDTMQRSQYARFPALSSLLTASPRLFTRACSALVDEFPLDISTSLERAHMATLSLAYKVRSYSTGTPGRALCNIRTHHFGG